jgi:hypothetical protein
VSAPGFVDFQGGRLDGTNDSAGQLLDARIDLFDGIAGVIELAGESGDFRVMGSDAGAELRVEFLRFSLDFERQIMELGGEIGEGNLPGRRAEQAEESSMLLLVMVELLL